MTDVAGTPWAALQVAAFLLSARICADRLTWLTMLNQPELSCPNFAEPNSGVCRCMVLKQWPIRACHALRSGALMPLCGSTNGRRRR